MKKRSKTCQNSLKKITKMYEFFKNNYKNMIKPQIFIKFLMKDFNNIMNKNKRQ